MIGTPSHMNPVDGCQLSRFLLSKTQQSDQVSRLLQEVRSCVVQHYESPSGYPLRGAGTSEVLEEHQHTEAAIGGR